MNYVKVKFDKLTIWAIKRELPNGLIAYTKCTSSGDTCPGVKINVIIAAKEDIVWEKPAVMNRKYAELEIDNGR